MSIRHGTWFSKSNLELEELLDFLFMWMRGYRQVEIEHELSTSSATNVDWSSFAREVCEEVMLRDGKKQIGGRGKIVEIDESKFTKRKYGVGHAVKGEWVFGGIERDSNECFAVPVPDRTAVTLTSVLKEHVKPGTTVYSDCWRAYSKLGEEGYTHLTVNHSLNFKDPETGVHTNGVEGMWQKIKHDPHIPKFGMRDGMLQGYLCVFMWLRRNAGKDFYVQFLKDVSRVYTGKCQQDSCKHCL